MSPLGDVRVCQTHVIVVVSTSDCASGLLSLWALSVLSSVFSVYFYHLEGPEVCFVVILFV